MNKLISVIVPVYNVENYLIECIESVVNQTYKNIEIILVDDGSTDTSGKICDIYAVKDKRIVVVHKKNGGLSDARNAGIRKATGDYLLFIDSDDYLDDINGIEELVCSITDDYDVVNYKYKKFDESTSTIYDCLPSPNYNKLKNILNNEDRLKWMISNSLFISSACNKLIKRKFLVDNNLFFELGRLSEDIVWSFKLLYYSKSMCAVDLDFYVYRQREGSITHTVNPKHIQDLLINLSEMTNLVENIETNELKNVFYNFISYQYGTMLIAIQYTNSNIKKKYYKQLKELSYLLKYDLDTKVRKLNKINKYFGFNILYLFCDIYAKVRK